MGFCRFQNEAVVTHNCYTKGGKKRKKGHILWHVTEQNKTAKPLWH